MMLDLTKKLNSDFWKYEILYENGKFLVKILDYRGQHQNVLKKLNNGKSLCISRHIIILEKANMNLQEYWDDEISYMLACLEDAYNKQFIELSQMHEIKKLELLPPSDNPIDYCNEKDDKERTIEKYLWERYHQLKGECRNHYPIYQEIKVNGKSKAIRFGAIYDHELGIVEGNRFEFTGG